MVYFWARLAITIVKVLSFFDDFDRTKRYEHCAHSHTVDSLTLTLKHLLTRSLSLLPLSTFMGHKWLTHSHSHTRTHVPTHGHEPKRAYTYTSGRVSRESKGVPSYVGKMLMQAMNGLYRPTTTCRVCIYSNNFLGFCFSKWGSFARKSRLVIGCG